MECFYIVTVAQFALLVALCRPSHAFWGIVLSVTDWLGVERTVIGVGWRTYQFWK